MPNILYTIFIFPIESIIEFCYVIAFRITNSPGFSILAVSIAVSTLVLPLYLMAERQQQAERDKQKEMKEELENIKAVFRGDKRFMMLSALYRQHNYHPILSLRNITGLLIQIPFFIAAYGFLNNLNSLQGQTFLFIGDLGSEDALFNGINILPFIMTALNLISGIIYTKNLSLRDKIQAYGVSLIFLVLLYNSSSALLLYWTFNNIYNLFKNILIKHKNHKKIMFFFVCSLFFVISIYILLFLNAAFLIRLIIFINNLAILSVILLKYFKRLNDATLNVEKTILEKPFLAFFLSILTVLILSGLFIPSTLINSSIEEFSNIKPFISPLPFIFITMLQSLGIVFYLFVIFLISKNEFKVHFTFFISLVLFCFLLNTVFFNPNYGFMTPDLLFSDFHNIAARDKIFNIFITIIILIPAIYLILNKRKIIFYSLQVIILISILVLSITQLLNINKNTEYAISPENHSEFIKSYTFSKHGQNILLLVLDTAKPGYLLHIFREKPELLDSFRGFTFYPNTISAGSFTMHGITGIYGGYNYSPFELNKQKDVVWRDKSVEAMQILPRILKNNGFNVSVTDQPWTNSSIYSKFNINYYRNIGRYRGNFTAEFDNFNQKNHFNILTNRLIRFSLFKMMPLATHSFIYNNGNYLTTVEYLSYSRRVIDNFSALYYLPEITEIKTDSANYASLIFNELTHEYAFFSPPSYFPATSIGFKGLGPFSNEYNYHTFIAAFSMLSKWFNFLIENDVYDNTRIIITSDHGSSSPSPFPDNILLPNGKRLDYYSAILMFKDFNASFNLKIDNTFMTNLDVPYMAAQDLVEKLIDPISGKEMTIPKDEGIFIPNVDFMDALRSHRTTGFVYTRDWLHVKENIFNPANWSTVTIE